MTQDSRENPKTKTQTSAAQKQNLSGAWDPVRFYRNRFRFYAGLLAFSVAVGVPMLALPSLRNRLHSRLQVLREAAQSSGRPAVVANIGENQSPFPSEYVRAIQPVLPVTQIPNLPYPSSNVYRPSATPSASAAAEPKPARRPPAPQPPRKEPSQAPAPVLVQDTGEADNSSSAEPEFRQGKIEQEAYDLLVKSSSTVAGLIGGVNPALKFKTWDAAKIAEDVYYVRLTFLRDNGEAPYIWQVKLQSKQVTPLNFNARSLPIQ